MRGNEALVEALGYLMVGLVPAAPVAVFMPRFNLYGYNGAAVLTIAVLLVSPPITRKLLSRFASLGDSE